LGNNKKNFRRQLIFKSHFHVSAMAYFHINLYQTVDADGDKGGLVTESVAAKFVVDSK